MPDFGERALADYPDRLEPSGADGWDLSHCRVISLTFELRKEQAMPFLPRTLIRPVPAYAKIIVIDAPNSPAGPYREAALLIGARENVQIRNVLMDSVVAGEAQLEAARKAFGGSRRAGTVQIRDTGEAIEVAIADSAGPLCELRMGALRRCDATMLKYDALLVPGNVDGEAALLRWGVRVPLTEVEGTLSRDWEVRMPRRGTAWHALRPAYNVTAFQSLGPARIEAARAPERTA